MNKHFLLTILAFLVTLTLVTLIAGPMYTTKLRDMLLATEQKLYLQNWHLQNLVPQLEKE